MKRMQNRMPTKSPNSNSLSDSGLVTCADQFSLASLLLVWLFSERWRIDAFELWCWRRLLTVPWTARRSNQSILNEISPGCSLEGMMLKLKLQYFGHLMRRVDSLEKTDAGRDWGQEEKGTTEDEMGGWHHRLDGRESECQGLEMQRVCGPHFKKMLICWLGFFGCKQWIWTPAKWSKQRIYGKQLWS